MSVRTWYVWDRADSRPEVLVSIPSISSQVLHELKVKFRGSTELRESSCIKCVRDA